MGVGGARVSNLLHLVTERVKNPPPRNPRGQPLAPPHARLRALRGGLVPLDRRQLVVDCVVEGPTVEPTEGVGVGGLGADGNRCGGEVRLRRDGSAELEVNLIVRTLSLASAFLVDLEKQKWVRITWDAT